VLRLNLCPTMDCDLDLLGDTLCSPPGSDAGDGVMQKVTSEVPQFDAASSEQAHVESGAFTAWSNESKRRLEAQVHDAQLTRCSGNTMSMSIPPLTLL